MNTTARPGLWDWSITFPFFDGFRTKGKVAQARSDVSSLKIDEAKMLDSISLQIRDTVNGVKEAGDIARGLAGTVSQAEKLLQMAEKGYEYGVKTRLEVEDAELNLSRRTGKSRPRVQRLPCRQSHPDMGYGHPGRVIPEARYRESSLCTALPDSARV